MKNYYKLLLVALIATVSFASCKKDIHTGTDFTDDVGKDIGTSVGGKTYLVSKIDYSNARYTAFEYDSKGRLSKQTCFEGGKSVGYSTLTYSGNTVTIDDTSNDAKTVLTIGANGYVSDYVRTEIYVEGKYTYTYKSTGKVTQNADGYVTKTVGTDVSSSTNPLEPQTTETSTKDFNYSNSNLTSDVEVNVRAGKTKTYTTTYEYYTEKAYSPALDIEDNNFLLTKPSKNLMKKNTQTNSEVGNTPYITNYTYTFNTDGLPNTIKRNNDTAQTITYITK